MTTPIYGGGGLGVLGDDCKNRLQLMIMIAEFVLELFSLQHIFALPLARSYIFLTTQEIPQHVYQSQQGKRNLRMTCRILIFPCKSNTLAAIEAKRITKKS